MVTIHRPLTTRHALSVTLLLVALISGCNQQADTTPYLQLAQRYDVEIERDRYGIPHILGDTDADAAFGLAYAQAEDNNAIIEEAVRIYRGELAAVNGKAAAPIDFLVKWLGVHGDIDAGFESILSEDIRAYLQAFADGINYYAAHHPEQFDNRLLPVTAKDMVAGYMIRHLLFYGFDATVSELTGPQRVRDISAGNTVVVAGVPTGSNAIALAPHRSEEGATRLAINSHQPLTGPVAWYEVHIRSREGLDVMGGLFPGSPTMGVGFNADFAWGATVNKPDLVDVYVLDIHPDDPMQYRLDGEWKTLEQTDIPIRVKLLGPFYWTVHRQGLRSVHGPVLQTEHGTYAVRYAGMGEMRQAEQWLAMSKATSVDEFAAALAQHRFASFNFVAADRTGNIGFFHNAMTPVRKGGFDWSQYLPGDNSALIWDRYLPWEQLPAMRSPPSGFILSANQSPFRISEDGSNPDPALYRREDGFQTRMTNRATRGLELFASMGQISAQEFSAIKHDHYYSADSRSGRWLARVIDSVQADDPDYGDARALLDDWDLSTALDNQAAALGTCVIHAEWSSEQKGAAEPDPGQTLRDCSTRLASAVGRIDPPYGEVNRHVRGALNLAVAGGPDTLRAIYATGLEDNGYQTNIAGDGLYYLVSWDSTGQQQVLGVHPFGSATLDERSEHYADQARDYAEERLHPALFEDAARAAAGVRRYRP